MAKLTVVPTPIGNLSDITARAVEVLKSCDFILAEDTRESSKLLNHYGIKKPVTSYHKFNEHQRLPGLIAQIQTAASVALISDAGTPGISDPGFLIVRECIENEIEVECLPGPVAFIPALVCSGLPCDRFVFEGFLPQKKGRKTRIEKLSAEERTVVLYESPFRLVKTLNEFAAAAGEDRKASVSREISKVYEEHVRGSLPELAAHFSKKPPKGEIVVVISGKK
jgi:16S rRNA (cytidine1402-2'-O)-methyltransferase